MLSPFLMPISSIEVQKTSLAFMPIPKRKILSTKDCMIFLSLEEWLINILLVLSLFSELYLACIKLVIAMMPPKDLYGKCLPMLANMLLNNYFQLVI